MTLPELTEQLTGQFRRTTQAAGHGDQRARDEALVRYVLTTLASDDDLAEQYDRMRWTERQVTV
jgi:hypothetical protein